MLHIITRLYRFDTLQHIYDSLPKEEDIHWHISKSKERESLSFDFLNDKRITIHEVDCHDSDRITKTNFVLDLIKDGYFCLLDDDTIFHENMYNAYRVCNQNNFIGMLMGQQLKEDGSLRLDSGVMRYGRIDTGQCFAHHSCLSKARWPNIKSIGRDFVFWYSVYVFYKNECIFSKLPVSWYNKLYQRKLLLLYPANKNHIDRLQKVAPTWRIVSTTDIKVAKREIVEAEVVMGNHNLCEVLPFNKRLRFLQTNSVGVDKILTKANEHLVDVAISNAKGLYTQEMCEHTIALLIMMHRELHYIRDYQNSAQWKRSVDIPTLQNKTALILGYGNLGKVIGNKLKAFDINVFGVNTEIQYFNEVHWKDLLPTIDFLILALPATKETNHMIDEKELNALQASCIVINVGRPESINQEYLIQMLNENKLKGAALDVLSEEPLPSNSPLWNMKNLFISPHTARSRETQQPFKFESFFEKNLRNYISFNMIENTINKNKGY